MNADNAGCICGPMWCSPDTSCLALLLYIEDVLLASVAPG